MESKTLEELRTMARALGLTGYSRLRRDQLLALLKSEAKAKRNKSLKAKPASRGGAKTRRPSAKISGPLLPPEPPARLMPQPAHISSAEERVETAKFAVAPPGVALSARALASDLREEIDRLPPPAESVLYLLPQKPGILHAYWVLAPGLPTNLRLRLCRFAETGLEIIEEIPLPAASGQWYFHVGEENEPGMYYVHLGHYDARGDFITAIRRGIARIPGIYASERTDRLWWISDAQFRAMYLRAGGFVRGARLGWAASIGSPAGGERLIWPGGVSSR
jgi:hypothetical protein